MIAGHYDAGARKGIKEGPRLQEFVFPGALRQIPGYDEQIRFDGANLGRDRYHKLALCSSEVQIRKVHEGFH
ncbi:hypothetical protein MesoLj113a_05770 [Mesorhizobium sp. 113-1-2]|nr:ABC transporter permease protein [Mesorhizobium loti]BCG69419.1 hypothetical protein MesoLj113a_05770 [Mesorhizobium sp. 113-1-2]